MDNEQKSFVGQAKKLLKHAILIKYIDLILLIISIGITMFYSLYTNKIKSFEKMIFEVDEKIVQQDLWNIFIVISILSLIVLVAILKNSYHSIVKFEELNLENEKQYRISKEFYLSNIANDYFLLCEDAIKKSLKKLVTRYSAIHSATVYKYDIKTYEGYAQIKLKPVKTASILNTRTTIIFENYLIDEDIYKRFVELRHKCSLYTKSTLPENLANELVRLLFELNEILKKDAYEINDDGEEFIVVDKLEDYHCTCFAVVNAIKALLEGVYSVDKTFYDELDQIFRKKMRTGILTSILLNSEYYHKHQGWSSKCGRMYMWRPFLLDGFNYILALNVQVDDLQNDLNKFYTNEEKRLENIYCKESIAWNSLRRRILEGAKFAFDETFDKMTGMNISQSDIKLDLRM